MAGTIVAGLAQSQSQAPPVFRADTELVTLDVTVLDQSRRPVRGLTAADFVIIDGDARLPVTAFTEINLPPVSARSLDAVSTLPPDVATNDVPEGRLIAILLDHTIPYGWPTLAARRIARSVLEQMGPGDRTAVLFSHSIPVQSFTSDRTQLLAAIDHPAPGPAPAPSVLRTSYFVRRTSYFLPGLSCKPRSRSPTRKRRPYFAVGSRWCAWRLRGSR